MASYVNIKKNLYGFCVSVSPISFKSKKLHHNVYTKKLDNSISRAKNVVYDLVLNNDFRYFVTLTVNDNHNRNDLNSIRLNINSRIKYMKKRGFSNLFYVLIPEHHKTGEYHLHGFFSGGFADDLYFNKNGFLSLKSFDSLGFTSITPINNYDACCKYVLKYINKDMCKSLKGEHLYFCSRGLNRSQTIFSFYSSDLQPLRFNYKSQFITKSFLDYYNFVTYIDYMYSNNKIYLVINDVGNILA